MRDLLVETGRSRNGLTMSGGMSFHAVDLTLGEPAQGLLVELWDEDQQVLASGRITQTGNPDCAALLAEPKPNGSYTARFHVAGYYRAKGHALPPTCFLDVVAYDFQSHDPSFHIHLPFKFSPWGFSCFRGN